MNGENHWAKEYGVAYLRNKEKFAELKKKKIKPHLVIEQCLEAKTVQTMDAAQAHAIDLKVVKALFN